MGASPASALGKFRGQAGDVAPLGTFVEEGDQVGHEGEVGLDAGFPAQFQ